LYCLSQVRRWVQQYKASVPASGPMPEALRLISWLETHVPSDDARPFRPAVCHGDYRLDNLVMDPKTLKVMGGFNLVVGKFASNQSSFHFYPHRTGNIYCRFPSLGYRQVKAVLDWELSTIGNPWADLAYNCLPYHLPQGRQECIPVMSGLLYRSNPGNLLAPFRLCTTPCRSHWPALSPAPDSP